MAKRASLTQGSFRSRLAGSCGETSPRRQKPQAPKRPMVAPPAEAPTSRPFEQHAAAKYCHAQLVTSVFGI